MNSWQIDNPEWMKARKKEWTYVQKALAVMKGDVKNKAIKSLRQYFLTGELPPEAEQRYILNRRWLLIRLWFHPDSSTENLQRLVDETPQKFELDYAKTIFFKYLSNPAYDLEPPYFLMGGKEKILARFFVPEAVNESCLSSSYDNFLLPGRFIMTFVISTWRLIFMGEGVGNPFSPHQYLVEYFDSCIKVYGDQSEYLNRKKYEPTIVAWLKDISEFVPDKVDPARVENATRFVHKMRDGFNAGRFGTVLQSKWKDITSVR